MTGVWQSGQGFVSHVSHGVKATEPRAPITLELRDESWAFHYVERSGEGSFRVRNCAPQLVMYISDEKWEVAAGSCHMLKQKMLGLVFKMVLKTTPWIQIALWIHVCVHLQCLCTGLNKTNGTITNVRFMQERFLFWTYAKQIFAKNKLVLFAQDFSWTLEWFCSHCFLVWKRFWQVKMCTWVKELLIINQADPHKAKKQTNKAKHRQLQLTSSVTLTITSETSEAAVCCKQTHIRLLLYWLCIWTKIGGNET